MTDLNPTDLLTCKKCNRRLPVTFFDRDKTKASGRRSQCKECRRPTTQCEPITDEEFSHVVNRNALLRLVHNHRAEFEALVNGERIRLRAERDGTTPEKAWASLA